MEVFELYKSKFKASLGSLLDLKPNLCFIDPGKSTGILSIQSILNMPMSKLTTVPEKDIRTFLAFNLITSHTIYIYIENYRTRGPSNNFKENLQERLIGFTQGLVYSKEYEIKLIEPNQHHQTKTTEKLKFACELLNIKPKTEHEKDVISMFIFTIEQGF